MEEFSCQANNIRLKERYLTIWTMDDSDGQNKIYWRVFAVKQIKTKLQQKLVSLSTETSILTLEGKTLLVFPSIWITSGATRNHSNRDTVMDFLNMFGSSLPSHPHVFQCL